ncbi:MAG: sigma-70 family RNA polymerase sigma factor [Tyzzerella sp.]|nr:sigma-70 family RNA polymerase sigma factor [Tyzzerella sp.]
MTNEQLVARIQASENEAENMLQLWKQNKGFIYKIAMKYQGYAEIEDLEQEGYLGLCEAVRHYDSEQGASFITYATFWIRQIMRRYINNCCSIVRMPVGAKEEVLQYKKIANEYRKWYGKEPTDKEMRSFLGVGREKLESIKKSALTVKIRSLSEPIGAEDEEFSLGDMVASEQDLEEDVMKRLDTEAMAEALWNAVADLPENYPEVLHYRYQDKMTLKEIGESIGVAPERARQIEKSALRKLRMPNRCAPFRGYYEQYLAPGPIYHVGLETFKRTWVSAVEAEVLGW